MAAKIFSSSDGQGCERQILNFFYFLSLSRSWGPGAGGVVPKMSSTWEQLVRLINEELMIGRRHEDAMPKSMFENSGW